MTEKDLAQNADCPVGQNFVPFVRLKPFPPEFRELSVIYADRVEIEIDNLSSCGVHVPPGVWLICDQRLVDMLTARAEKLLRAPGPLSAADGEQVERLQMAAAEVAAKVAEQAGGTPGAEVDSAGIPGLPAAVEVAAMHDRV